MNISLMFQWYKASKTPYALFFSWFSVQIRTTCQQTGVKCIIDTLGGFVPVVFIATVRITIQMSTLRIGNKGTQQSGCSLFFQVWQVCLKQEKLKNKLGGENNKT